MILLKQTFFQTHCSKMLSCHKKRNTNMKENVNEEIH